MHRIRKSRFLPVLAVCLLLWGAAFFVDYTRCLNLKAPLFVVPLGVTADDGGSGTYAGLGYTVELDKHLDAEYGSVVDQVEMRVLGRVIAASIA